MNLEQNLIFFLISWLVIFLGYYYFILRNKLNMLLEIKPIKKRKNNTEKNVEIMEISYLVSRFKLDKKKLYKNSIILWIAFLDSFIISLVSTIIYMIPFKFFFQILIGFVLLFALIYAIYEIFGRILVKRGY